MGASTESARGAGWLLFAGVMVLMAGTLNLVDGIAAASTSHFFVGDAHFIVSNLHTWGWVHIVTGGLMVLVGFGILGGNEFARWIGVVLAAVNVVSQLIFIQTYPFWSLAIFSIDILIIYGLVAYGGRQTARA